METSPSIPSSSPVPELLAPAGDMDCIHAAVENGADAVYFGLDHGFNARARATNFSIERLDEPLGVLHGRGVRAYVTLNTLVFPHELEEVERTVRMLASGGVDAVLVQDLGLVRLVRECCPGLAIHASTQMTLTSAETIAAAAELGVDRVVLARELSIREIAKIHSQTPVPLEAFVHGALCVAYSGQCLTSEALGGRSANRGQCAQACRLPYELVCDGRDVATGRAKYLLSPQDLAAYALVPDLIAAGVCSLKIEGRLKTAEYVANITRHYRRAIDDAVARRTVNLSAADVEEMQLSFSRGFSPGWLEGCDHKMLVPATSSAKRGVSVGRVIHVRGRRATVALTATVRRGDGVVFEGDRAEGLEQGGRIYEVFLDGQSVDEAAAGQSADLAFGHDAVDCRELWAGQELWKTDDPRLTKRLRATFGGTPRRRIAVDLHATAAPGEPLRIAANAASGQAVTLQSDEPLETARKHPLTCDVVEQQFGRLGGTAFELRRVTASISGSPMAPLSVLGAMRRRMVQALNLALQSPACGVPAPPHALARLRRESESSPREVDRSRVELHVHCRSMHQLSAAIEAGGRNLQVDFADIRQYGQAVELARAAGASILLATPRIQKPDEMGLLRSLERHGADGVLVRNLAAMRHFRGAGVPFVVDFSLNAANDLTVDYLLGQGALRVTPSYDLNRDQLLDLVDLVPADRLEAVIHQHMPLFHMEHCVFCAMLSPGTNKTNCGRPCDRHEVRLRDRQGVEHPLHADVGCRNTLYNAVPQSGAEMVPALIRRGVRHFRVELLNDAPVVAVQRTIDLYCDLIAGNQTGKTVWSSLRAMNRVGVTRGTMEHGRDPLAII